MTRRIPPARLRTAAGACLFAFLTLIVGAIFLRGYAPPEAVVASTAKAAMATAPMDEQMTPDVVSGALDRILAAGSRGMGQDGHRLVQRQIREAFEKAGLEIHELPQDVLVPRTLRRDILGADGRPLEGVEVYPFLPNHFQPISTPAEGATGELVLITDEVLLERPRFDDAIAVIDLAHPPTILGINWIAYAKRGFQAYVLTHSEGFSEINWPATGGVRSSVPVNFTRVAASEGVLKHLGERVTLHVRAVWETVEDVALIGVMPAPSGPSDEALVIHVSSDAPSMLPDHAPGTLGAVNLAIQSAMLEGFAATRDDPARRRDIVFVSTASRAMALTSADELTTILGPAWDRPMARRILEERRLDNEHQRKLVAAVRACFDDPAFLDDAETTHLALGACSPEAVRFFTEELALAVNNVSLERADAVLSAQLAFLDEGATNLASAAYSRYRQAKMRYDENLSFAGLPIRKLLAEPRSHAFVQESGLRARFVARLDELLTFHEARDRATVAAIALHDRFARYRNFVMLGLFLAPDLRPESSGESLTFAMGGGSQQSRRNAGVTSELLLDVLQRDQFPGLRVDSYRGTKHESWAESISAGVPQETTFWTGKGYTAFTLLSSGRAQAYAWFGSPIDVPALHRLETMRESLRLTGRVALALAAGEGTFEPTARGFLRSYSGRVFASNVGRSIVPNHPMGGAIIGHKGRTGTYEQPGYARHPFLVADPYGRYERMLTNLLIQPYGMPYSPEAAVFGPDGVIAYIKDEGSEGQRIYKSINVGAQDRRNINLVVFRAAPVALFDIVNPQTLSNYSGVGFLRREGLVAVAKHNFFGGANDMVLAFLEPATRIYLTFKAGSADQPKVQSIRAFMLGVEGDFAPDPRLEIDGPGYLAGLTPRILDVPQRTAASMHFLNGRRIEMQRQHDMADRRVQEFQERGEELMARADQDDRPQHDKALDAQAAVAYATLNYPVLRGSIHEAIVSILWYLGLLVPFVFFFERLAFGFSTIHKRLIAQAGIFLVVFISLRLLHPAFGMIRSSLMILLGFVIMLVSGGITILFSGKFKENLEELRKRRGQATAADANTLGILGTAFVLGLNNMHRRIVRTGLTCATLVLITFAMICFTSIHSDLVDDMVAVGKATYQGLLIKGDRMAAMDDAQLAAIQMRYGARCKVAPRRMLVGRIGGDQVPHNPEIEAVYQPEGRAPRSANVSSVIEFSPQEPLRNRFRLLAGVWPEPATNRAPDTIPPIFLADELASSMGIRPNDLDSGELDVTINGVQAQVIGIFAASELEALRDLDGRDLLPFNVEAMQSIQVQGGQVVADDSDPRLDAAQMIIAFGDIGIGGAGGQRRLVSVAVDMSGMSYKEANGKIVQYLEQSGNTTYYGLNGVAYRGRRARDTGVGGLLELLVPLLIGSMTVLNTMKGSVYERRDEIFVYNAVGIAPRYIFAMFLSEAFVYAVIGSMLGFLLSQGVGKALTALNLTGGLPMTFTSIHTIYASLAVMAAVFFSTLFPARSAMHIAMPTDDASGWRLPEPEGDDLSFSMPFTFDPRDRLAVCAFTRRYLLDHGEGGAGRFHAAPPELLVEPDPGIPGTSLPLCSGQVWLKPFDLGVSQRLAIRLPFDHKTNEYRAVVTLTRLTGSRESWIRLNHAFVALLRRHYLFWRAVGPDERETLYQEARQVLRERLATQGQEDRPNV